ncbi:TPA_asm: hypothetical protein GND15_004392 [Salmonella enterica subsp. salamae serovar 58:d:z6]|uniref:Ead/Ea22-like family protein n=1 Tax=Salmonella enterica subsp. salamae serovar 58:d:z6 TaxID=41517 RepID=A0A737SQ39_SALER|nr:hypothetical protein [Salmonella enterica]EAA6224097.1 hypothetical protein [Salmonella enterica subsp. salamae]ECG1421848.1 hypothetical protein [Salmonella enterica subsp. salamae str. CFSAN000559]QRR37446.1 hypothetical protein JQN60_16340 [Salmonella enterica subsp. enterica]HAE2716451.1 hypothetical protein [Salmonella enterica subsp. salamae serovar 58:d:z6]HAE2990488.1 hypothetical protein [Salmonella enterica subsp. salamae serovar 58:d:z6]
MKEVKIYTIVSDQLSPPITGESYCTDMVRHSDYAELEAKCMALAAENVAQKSALNDILQPDAAVLERNHRVRALDAMETPATDAFLAEARAQGVEMFSEKFGGGTPLSNLVKEVAADFAAKLRKGVAQ